MVMKRNAMRTNLRQSILRSFGRYLAILAIIALGASMFVGLRMTKADMVATGQVYTDRTNMFDLRLVSSYGWGEEDLEAMEALAAEAGLTDVEGTFYTDLIAKWGEESDDGVYRFYTLPETVNTLTLVSGRMPQAPNECLADGYQFDPARLGSKVLLSQGNEEDSLELVKERTFTVVGAVSTPLYMDMNRGTTSIGSGSITNYFFVPEDAFDVDYYTEIYVTIPGDYKIYSDTYNDALDAKAEELETRFAPIAEDRFQRVKQEATDAYEEGLQEYEEGLQEFRDGKKEAQQELADAEQELKDGEQELLDNEQLLRDGEEQIKEGKKLLAEGEKTLATSRQTLANAKAEAYKQVSAANAELFQNYQTVTANLQQVESGLLQLSTGITQLEAGLEQLDSGIEMIKLLNGVLDISVKTAQEALEFAKNNALTTPEQLEELQKGLDELLLKQQEYAGQLEDLQSQRTEYGTQLEELYAQQTELQAARQQLEEGLAAIDQGYKELESSQITMEQQFASTEAQIEAGEAQIKANRIELETREQEIADGWIALEEGKQEIADGWKEFEEAKEEVSRELAQAEQELADAKLQLADAKELIDGMTESSLILLDRNTNVGYASLDSSSDIVAGVSRVFPVFFLLVAALVCITTMTRMVDEERTQIGTLKALGYSNNAIISKYLIYAGSGALLGCGLGVLLGSAVFPMILWEAYKIMLFIQDSIVLTFDWGLCLVVVIAYTVVMLLVTWYCCYKTLAEVPAELIRPKAPAVGKQLLFEKLPFWNRVSFLNKVTIRNIFRYRQRLAMMMVGIGGCTALLLTGFGLRDSIVNIVDFQFQDITTYDMSVYFAGDLTQEDMDSFRQELPEGVEDMMFYHQTSMEITFDDQTREIYLVAAEPAIQRFFDFHHGDQALDMPGPGETLLSIGVAEAMGVKTGDQVILRNADMEELELTVSGIYYNHVYNYTIVSPETIQAQWGTPPANQMAFLTLREGADAHLVSAKVSGMENVMNVSVSEDLAFMVRNMMDALDLVVWVIVFCAGLLAAIVLYNLTNININERIREIATIKVLGFNAKETAMYIFKENLTLSVFGAFGGLLLGKLLLDFVMSEVKINMVWFLSRALPLSYILSVAMTILMAIIVDFIFYFKLEKINMAEALKSVE